MNIDYHTHHERCGHAAGSLREYIEQAIERGIDQLGLSDHMPLIHLNPDDYLPEVAMSLAELSNYVEECYNLKNEYKQQIEIRVGIEADYIEGFEREIETLLSYYEWDYVIGSVHFIGRQSEWDITDYRMVHMWEGQSVEAVYKQYYDKVAKAAQCGLFDIIGHFDAIKRFGFVCKRDPSEWQYAALDAICKQQLTIELNTAGWQAKCMEQYPAVSLLEYACKQGIPVTLGSDAHQPAHLQRDFERAIELLKKTGYRKLATFDQRKRVMIDLA